MILIFVGVMPVLFGWKGRAAAMQVSGAVIPDVETWKSMWTVGYDSRSRGSRSRDPPPGPPKGISNKRYQQ